MVGMLHPSPPAPLPSGERGADRLPRVERNNQYRIVLISNGFNSGRSDSRRAAMPARCGAAQLVAGSWANGPR